MSTFKKGDKVRTGYIQDIGHNYLSHYLARQEGVVQHIEPDGRVCVKTVNNFCELFTEKELEKI